MTKKTKKPAPRATRQDAEEHFWRIGLQYYTAARSARLCGLESVCGNLFHHAIEMLLKAGLSQTLDLEELRDYRHNLRSLWTRFKREFQNAGLTSFDNAISKLDLFEQIRYPDSIMQKGMAIIIDLVGAPPSTFPAQPKTPQYALVVNEIDKLVIAILDACSRTEKFFTQSLNKFGRDALTRENPMRDRWLV